MTHLTILSREIRLHGGLYSLSDLHKASGGEKKHTPSRFIRNSQTQNLITEIERDPNMGFGIRTVHGGQHSGTYACKELVYAYAMWISPKFHLHVIRAFDQLQECRMPEPAPSTIEQKWEQEQAHFFSLDTNKIYLELPSLMAALDSEVKALARDDDNEYRSMRWFLNEADKRIRKRLIPGHPSPSCRTDYVSRGELVAILGGVISRLAIPEAR